jgi:hypothetical protein
MTIMLHVGKACGTVGETNYSMESILFLSLGMFDSCVGRQVYTEKELLKKGQV